MPLSVNLCVQNEEYSVSVRRSKPLLPQIRSHLIDIGFSKSKVESCIIMFNSMQLEENDTIRRLNIRRNSNIDVYFPIPQSKASSSLVSHLRSEGLDPSKFVFIDESIAFHMWH